MPSPRTKQARNESMIVDLDMRDDSSDDGEDEITTHSSHGPANHKIKNTVRHTLQFFSFLLPSIILHRLYHQLPC